MPFGATPVWPWRKSQKPTPRTVTGRRRRLEARRGGEARVELPPRIGHARSERTAGADAIRRGDLDDHRAAGAVLDDEVIVGVAFASRTSSAFR